MAQVYSGGRDPVVARIRIENPYEIDAFTTSTADVAEWARMFKMADARERLIGSGYDGVVYREGVFLEVVAFHAEQIENLGRHPSFEAAQVSRISAIRI